MCSTINSDASGAARRGARKLLITWSPAINYAGPKFVLPAADSVGLIFTPADEFDAGPSSAA